MIKAKALEPELAIVVPVYNGTPTLRASLQAILNAPGPSREIVVVDDGSSDGSAEIAEVFGVRVICQQNAGDAAARNHGVEATSAGIIVFVDADVVIHSDALRRIADFMAENRDYAAVFGSYDAEPPEQGFVSQYRNLLHHFTHQGGDPEAETFWTGLGAVRRSAFKRVGAFRSDCDPIADIALGLRLRDAGFRIRLDQELLGTHLKAWNLRTMVATDIFSRALPWTTLILNSGCFRNGLATRPVDRFAVASAVATVAFGILALAIPVFGLVATLCVLASLGANARLFRQFSKKRGPIFAVGVVPLQLLHRVCAGAGFILALKQRLLSRTASAFQGSALPSARASPATLVRAVRRQLMTTSS